MEPPKLMSAGSMDNRKIHFGCKVDDSLDTLISKIWGCFKGLFGSHILQILIGPYYVPGTLLVVKRSRI